MVAKSRPFSIRLSPRLDRLITEEARRTKRAKGAVVETLADEAMRARRYPGIAFRGEDWSRRAWVLGTALDVWQIIEAYHDFGSVAHMVAETDLTERQVKLAIAYYRDFGDEVDAAIVENRRPLHELRELFPHLDVHE
jgi:hypothetical protein